LSLLTSSTKECQKVAKTHFCDHQTDGHQYKICPARKYKPTTNAMQQQTITQQATFDEAPSIRGPAGGKLQHPVIEFSNKPFELVASLVIVNCSTVQVSNNVVELSLKPVEFQLYRGPTIK
jgi:hypothetical protein